MDRWCPLARRSSPAEWRLLAYRRAKRIAAIDPLSMYVIESTFPLAVTDTIRMQDRVNSHRYCGFAPGMLRVMRTAWQEGTARVQLGIMPSHARGLLATPVHAFSWAKLAYIYGTADFNDAFPPGVEWRRIDD